MRDNEEKYAGHCERGNVLHPWENFLHAAVFPSLCGDRGFACLSLDIISVTTFMCSYVKYVYTHRT